MAEVKAIRALMLIDRLYDNAGGGTEKQFIKFCQMAPRYGIEPNVVFLRHEPVHDDIQWPVSPITLGMASFSPAAVLTAIKRLRSLNQDRSIDVVHSFFDDSAVLASLYRVVFRNIPFVCSQRNIGHHRGVRQDLLFRWVYAVSDMTCPNSDGIRSMLTTRYKVAPCKIHLVDNIVDADEFGRELSHSASSIQGIRDNVDSVGLCVANLRAVKGISDLIEAVAILRDRGNIRTRILISGDGPSRHLYEKMISDAGLGDSVWLLGYRDDVTTILRQVDYCVLPSRAEGASNALVEYMIAGLPIVATDIGGNPDMLQNGKFGQLVAPGKPESLGDGIAKLIADLGQAREIGQDARTYALSRFSADTVFAEYRAMYASVVRSNRSRRRLADV